jgi:NADH:ubiquinone oxidoreductase subunit E
MLTIVVCVGSSCYVRGSEKLAETFEKLIQSNGLKARVELMGAYCMERCSMGVSVHVGDQVYKGVHLEDAESFFQQEVMPLVAAGVAK